MVGSEGRGVPNYNSKENTMKQHEKRFIIEVKGYDNKWVRSGNFGLTDFFATRKGATKALASGDRSSRPYRVRQK